MINELPVSKIEELTSKSHGRRFCNQKASYFPGEVPFLNKRRPKVEPVEQPGMHGEIGSSLSAFFGLLEWIARVFDHLMQGRRSATFNVEICTRPQTQLL